MTLRGYAACEHVKSGVVHHFVHAVGTDLELVCELERCCNLRSILSMCVAEVVGSFIAMWVILEVVCNPRTKAGNIGAPDICPVPATLAVLCSMMHAPL